MRAEKEEKPCSSRPGHSVLGVVTATHLMGVLQCGQWVTPLPLLPRHILAHMPGERATLETLCPPPTYSLTHSHRALSPGEVIVLLKCKKKIPPQVSCILKLKQTSL